MATITMVQINVRPGVPGPTTETVDIYVYDSASTNLWIWTVRESAPGVPIPAGTPLTTIQAMLDANANALYAAIIANAERPIATGMQAVQRQWIAAHLVWHSTFLAALWTLDNGILTIPSLTLANYQAIIASTVTVINSLPAPFLSHLSNERIAQGVSAAPTTLAQCVTLDNLLHTWLCARMNMTHAARDIGWWLNGGIL